MNPNQKRMNYMAGSVRPYSGSSTIPNSGGSSGVLNVPGTRFGVSRDGIGYGDSTSRGRISVNPITGGVTYEKKVGCTIL